MAFRVLYFCVSRFAPVNRRDVGRHCFNLRKTRPARIALSMPDPKDHLENFIDKFVEATEEFENDVATLKASLVETSDVAEPVSPVPPVTQEELLSEIANVETKLQSIQERMTRVIKAEKK